METKDGISKGSVSIRLRMIVSINSSTCTRIAYANAMTVLKYLPYQMI